MPSRERRRLDILFRAAQIVSCRQPFPAQSNFVCGGFCRFRSATKLLGQLATMRASWMVILRTTRLSADLPRRRSNPLLLTPLGLGTVQILKYPDQYIDRSSHVFHIIQEHRKLHAGYQVLLGGKLNHPHTNTLCENKKRQQSADSMTSPLFAECWSLHDNGLTGGVHYSPGDLSFDSSFDQTRSSILFDLKMDRGNTIPRALDWAVVRVICLF
ncbi:hypothetical protein QBC38DRAFT_141223 [Podospora fimiseda]|uniref:Uncharacterized protein n=1 Tax=Podospora fimiseda TaxID=252190 RepID=A0AAN7BSH3_9PEZI|nr:hypothetical protein QBC38DRAFT_141223 [Podospora fimiseda]